MQSPYVFIVKEYTFQLRKVKVESEHVLCLVVS